jgi:HTH-type transcriptional regulator, competence development regulator
MPQFGSHVRKLRKAKGYSLRELSAKVGVGHSYLCRVENGRLNYGDYPSESLIARLADVFETDEEELLILARKIPDWVKMRILNRPDIFLRLAALDDKQLDRVLKEFDPLNVEGPHPEHEP